MTDREAGAAEVLGPDRSGPWVIVCDHASNRVPLEIGGGSLGLTACEMTRHIAWDVGAAGATRALAGALDAPAVLGRFSRLVIDNNRGEDDPTLLMRLYDGTIVPANRHADGAERARRLALFHRPYHAVLERLAARPGAALVSIHSYTPQLKGRGPRPWHVGVLSAGDRRLADPLLARLRAGSDLCVGDNQPYGGHLPGDSVDRHALRHGRPNVLIELRSDLIRTPGDQAAWGARLAPLLAAARADAGL